MIDRGLLNPQSDSCITDIDEPSKASPSTPGTLEETAEGNEAVLSCTYKTNCTALFKAIEQEKWFDVIRFLDTSFWPGLSFARDVPALQQTVTVVTNTDEESETTWSYLPVHMAILRGAPLDVVGRLVDLAPKTLNFPDHDGNLALHLAMSKNSRYDVQEYILFANPSAVSSLNSNGKTPLQCALGASNERSVDRGKILNTFITLGVASSKILKKKEIDKFYDYDKDRSPLFKAITEMSWQSVELFLTNGKFGQATTTMEHIWASLFLNEDAAENDHSDPTDQVTMLFKKWDENRKLEWARLPIHQAILLGAPLPVVEKLIQLYPGSLSVADNKGMLPLHLALQHNSKDAVISFLLEKLPIAVQVADMEGRFPVEMALQGENPLRGEVIKAFMENHVYRYTL